ncbi:MAG: hypothetical protein K1000chlam4_00010 [Chlamydiae bacterium]|nr:hypothetical protein [Chlamydiota bacterium]
MLIADDNSFCSAANIVPFPIEVLGKEGRKISMERMDTLPASYWVYFQNFKPNEIVYFQSITSGEIHRDVLQINENGEMHMQYVPVVKDKKFGESTFQIVIPETDETMELSEIWRWPYDEGPFEKQINN